MTRPAGQEDAEFLLEHQEEIPEELRPFYFPFTATIWRHPDGDLVVSCLYFSGERWNLIWYWLELEYDSDARLLRPGNSLRSLSDVFGRVFYWRSEPEMLGFQIHIRNSYIGITLVDWHHA